MQQHLVAEAANTELQARLATAQAQLAQATEAASLQQQDQELLQERLQQVGSRAGALLLLSPMS
jgi:uncharacterized protein YigA (DUF484 family)